MTLADLKVYHTFSFLLEPRVNETLQTLTEKLAGGPLHSAGRAAQPKPVRVSSSMAKSSEPTDDELLARLFV